jgi:tetratricopeptide (TPR) repeat protein
MAIVLASLPAGLVEEVDARWAQRTPANRTAIAQELAKRLEPHQGDFEAAWRLARCYVWIADEAPYYRDTKTRFRLGKKAMNVAKRAVQMQPKRVEGHYYYAWAVGQWSLGISIAKALWEGAESKYTGALKKVDQLDRSFDQYGALRMWGRYYHSLPWPKRNRAKSAKYLRTAVKKAPTNLRSFVYLAETLIGQGEHKSACDLVTKALKLKGNSAKEPDWDLWQKELVRLKNTGCKKLLENL